MEAFQEKLRGLREDHDLTQQEIAGVLGTSQTMYAHYERGASELPLRRFYHVSADYLLGLSEEKAIHAAPARGVRKRCDKLSF